MFKIAALLRNQYCKQGELLEPLLRKQGQSAAKLSDNI